MPNEPARDPARTPANPAAAQPELSQSDLGQQLRFIREEKGLSREDLAVRTGFDLSAVYIKQIENGARPVQKASTLATLARALDLDNIAELTGGLTWSIGHPEDLGRSIHPATERMRRMLHRPHLGGPAPDLEVASPAALDELQQRCDEMWRIWHTAPMLYSTIASSLPGLMETAEKTVAAVSGTAPAEQAQRRRAWGLLAQAHHLARQWLRKVQEYNLAEIAAHRALVAAQQADDPLLIAFTGWNFAGLHNASGRYEDGQAVCEESIAFLRGLSVTQHDPRLTGMVGALRLYESISLARQFDGDGAWALWREADEIARGLGPDFWDDWTTFGRSNINFYAVGILVELGTGEAAIDRAGDVDVASMPCRERQSRYLIDVGKAHFGRGEDDAALAVLRQAEEAGPEEMAYSFYGRDVVRSLVRRSRVTDRRALMDFAKRLQVVN
jgi:transcriptional regulator with XRE-family HTH domain